MARTVNQAVNLLRGIYAADWQGRQQRGIGIAEVFPSLAQKGGAGTSGLSLAFKRLMDRANVAPGIARLAKECLISEVRTLRQTNFRAAAGEFLHFLEISRGLALQPSFYKFLIRRW